MGLSSSILQRANDLSIPYPMKTRSTICILPLLVIYSCDKLPDGSEPVRATTLTVKYEFLSSSPLSGSIPSNCFVWYSGAAGTMTRAQVTTFPWSRTEVVSDTSKGPIFLVAALQGGFFERRPKVTGHLYVNDVRVSSAILEGSPTGTGFYWLSQLQLQYEIK